MRQPKTKPGFSLLETLLAGMILSATVVTVGALSTHALQGVSRQAYVRTALSLADRQLRMIDYIGVDRFLEQGQLQGIIEKPAPGFQWQVQVESLEVGLLYSVSITMTWMERGGPQTLQLQTRLNGVGVDLPAEDGHPGGRS